MEKIFTDKNAFAIITLGIFFHKGGVIYESFQQEKKT